MKIFHLRYLKGKTCSLLNHNFSFCKWPTRIFNQKIRWKIQSCVNIVKTTYYIYCFLYKMTAKYIFLVFRPILSIKRIHRPEAHFYCAHVLLVYCLVTSARALAQFSFFDCWLLVQIIWLQRALRVSMCVTLAGVKDLASISSSFSFLSKSNQKIIQFLSWETMYHFSRRAFVGFHHLAGAEAAAGATKKRAPRITACNNLFHKIIVLIAPYKTH